MASKDEFIRLVFWQSKCVFKRFFGSFPSSSQHCLIESFVDGHYNAQAGKWECFDKIKLNLPSS